MSRKECKMLERTFEKKSLRNGFGAKRRKNSTHSYEMETFKGIPPVFHSDTWGGVASGEDTTSSITEQLENLLRKLI